MLIGDWSWLRKPRDGSLGRFEIQGVPGAEHSSQIVVSVSPITQDFRTVSFFLLVIQSINASYPTRPPLRDGSKLARFGTV